MTDQLTALKELAEKIEAGEQPRDWFQCAFRDADIARFGLKAATGSLDAAHALHKAVFHESVECIIDYTIRYGANVVLNFRDEDIGHGQSYDSLSRAWLLAIIKAKISELESKQ